jgi:hypothetical protein
VCLPANVKRLAWLSILRGASLTSILMMRSGITELEGTQEQVGMTVGMMLI